MNVFSYSQWQYDLMQDDDVMECSTCGDEAGITYIIANTEDEVDSLINTDRGQQCSACLAMFLSTTKHTVTPPTVYRESN
jgi:hypothetical protein|tara:strand:- start:39 stop:278 length:240 start_codon:yes stop_codon:yes gene_type:complete